MRPVPLKIHRRDKGIRFEISEYWQTMLSKLLTDNGNDPINSHIIPLATDSRNQRGFFHGGLIPLQIALDGNDYKDSKVCAFYFDTFMEEMFPEVIKRNGKICVMGKSSKGILKRVTDAFITYLVEDYGMEYTSEVLDPQNYKDWRDKYSMTIEYEDYFEYAKSMKWLEFSRLN